MYLGVVVPQGTVQRFIPLKTLPSGCRGRACCEPSVKEERSIHDSAPVHGINGLLAAVSAGWQMQEESALRSHDHHHHHWKGALWTVFPEPLVQGLLLLFQGLVLFIVFFSQTM
jgi:hypothetical protein